MNFNNITTLATGLAAWAVEMAGQEETPAYLVGTLALGALTAFGAYLYVYYQRPQRGASHLLLSCRCPAVPPDLSPYPQLHYLNLSNNWLTTVPNLSHTPQLQTLDLSHNQLTIAPDVSHTPQLHHLNLEYNQLTELHDSVFSLPRDSVVFAEHNRFSAEYVAEFQERLRQHRLDFPDQGPRVNMSIYDAVGVAAYMSFLDAAGRSPFHGIAPASLLPNAAPISLEEELSIWSQEFEIAFPEAANPELWAHRQPINANLEEHFAQLHFLSVDEKVMLASYLRQLRNVQDYKNGGEDRRGIVLRIERMLQLANQNPAFRKEILQLIQQGTVSCGDRVQLYFDEIEIAWHFSHLSHRERSPAEFRHLTIRAERCRQLQLYAERQAALHQLGDEVETILYYRVRLRDALDLPVSTRNMLYPGVSGVTREMLDAARAEIEALSDDQLLATSPHWQARMAQLHQSRVNDITNQYTGFLNDLGDYFDLESVGEQEQYLESRDDLAELIGRAISLDIVGYPAVSGFIDLERQRVISELI